MSNDEIINLLVKQKLNELTLEEEKKLANLSQQEKNICLVQQIKSLVPLLEDYTRYSQYNSDYYRYKQEVLRKSQCGKRKRMRLSHLYKYAAILLFPFLLAISIYYLFFADKSFNQPIPPGKELAILELPSKEVIHFSKGAVKLYKIDGSEMIVEREKVFEFLKQKQTFDQSNYSTITVPVGGIYSLDLSDGTHIWLNSNSKMKFPLTFNKKERRIWIEGEAWLNVAKDSIPFIVSTQFQDIKVLGTSFNLTAYPEERSITTALVSGRIELTSLVSEEKTVIDAGSCVRLDKNTGETTVFEDDAQYYGLWHMGIFKFREQALEDIVRSLQRWYKFDVNYQSEAVKQMRFSVVAFRDNDLDSFFDLLCMTTSIKYKRRGNRIVLAEN
ncbi:MAG: FecR family protein [Bacteroidales bacterium]|nr:FecR family protein [Bacteroidales bacterium]